MKISECRGCGAKIVWTKTPGGARMPLDMGVGFYRITDELSDGVPILQAVKPLDEGIGISHFRTCPKADRFGAGSGSRSSSKGGSQEGTGT